MVLTKQDIKSIGEVIDAKLTPIQKDIGDLKSGQVSLQQDVSGLKVGQVSSQRDINELKLGQVNLQQDINEIKNDVRGLREQIQQLAITLDNFVKMMTDYKEEFIILKSEVDQIKRILKEKLGIDVAVQR